MRPSLWFVVPAHGRLALSAICLRQLRRTCDALELEGVDASAVVIADDENLKIAGELGFGTIRRDNAFLSRRYNDGIQLATDRAYNSRPVDFVVPCGSDDFVDAALFVDLPPPDVVVGFQYASFVREDGRELTARYLNYEGGCGIRIYPRELVATLGYRPADEDRRRGCDTSILANLKRATPLVVEHRELDPRQIVDWKSPDAQTTPYETIAARHRGSEPVDPYEALAEIYPADALEAMSDHYGVRGLVPA